MRVSVHLLTKDRPTEASILLNSLRHQTFKDWDLVIWDEGKESINNYKYVTDVLNRIKLEKHSIFYTKNNLKKGISHARNMCVETDRFNDVFIRIDDDSVCEPDYIERLVSVYLNNKKKDGKDCCVGGLVPPFNSPEFYRDCTNMKVFNKAHFDENGIYRNDDGGYVWLPHRIIPSHHLRSSFLFTRKIWEDVGGFKLSSNIGWEEETLFCFEAIYKGYKLFTDTGAICFHAHGRSGGARLPTAEYEELRKRIEDAFQKRMKRLYMREGNKFIDTNG